MMIRSQPSRGSALQRAGDVELHLGHLAGKARSCHGGGQVQHGAGGGYVKILYDHYIKVSNDELLWLRTFEKPFFWQVQLLRHSGQRDCLDGAGWLGGEGRARFSPGWLPRDSDHVLPISHCSSSMLIRIFTFCSDS